MGFQVIDEIVDWVINSDTDVSEQIDSIEISNRLMVDELIK